MLSWDNLLREAEGAKSGRAGVQLYSLRVEKDPYGDWQGLPKTVWSPPAPCFSLYWVMEQKTSAQETSYRCHLVATLRCHLGLSIARKISLPVPHSLTQQSTRDIPLPMRDKTSLLMEPPFLWHGETTSKPPLWWSVLSSNLARLYYQAIPLKSWCCHEGIW